MCFYLCFSSFEYNIILLLKYTCVEFIFINLPWENQIEHSIILAFEKVNQLVARALVAIRKKNKIVKLKPQH